jgi:hypothetical protein
VCSATAADKGKKKRVKNGREGKDKIKI